MSLMKEPTMSSVQRMREFFFTQLRILILIHFQRALVGIREEKLKNFRKTPLRCVRVNCQLLSTNYLLFIQEYHSRAKIVCKNFAKREKTRGRIRPGNCSSHLPL